MLNYSALEIEAEGLEFVRKNGTWRVDNDPTGSTITIIPEAVMMMGFGLT